MTDEEIYRRLTEIFRDVFDSEELILTSTTTARDVRGWDSLGTIRMVLTVEKALNIRFATSEVASQRDVGAFVSLIKTKLEKRR